MESQSELEKYLNARYKLQTLAYNFKQSSGSLQSTHKFLRTTHTSAYSLDRPRTTVTDVQRKQSLKFGASDKLRRRNISIVQDTVVNR